MGLDERKAKEKAFTTPGAGRKNGKTNECVDVPVGGEFRYTRGLETTRWKELWDCVN